MKLTLSQLLIMAMATVAAFAGASNAQEILDKQITISIENQSLKYTLEDIERKAEVKFAYSRDAVSATDEITIYATRERLGDVLDKLLKPRKLDYQVIGKQIIVNQTEARKETGSSTLHAAPKDFPLTGKVSTEKGEPIPGVNILIKGTTVGTVSDSNGNFTVSVPDASAVLVFSFIGFATQEVAVEGRSSIQVTLVEDVKSLDAVVVVGYGTQKKSDLTGAVSTVSARDVEGQATSNINQALQGKIAGVTFTNTSGDPGDAVQVRIRGLSTFGSSGPLYIVDGLPMQQADVNSIDPNDIESFTVLKDGSAAAIYGARSANGVILLTTKSGGNKAPTVSVNSYYGIQTFNKFIPLLNSQQMADVINEAHVNGNFYPLQPAMNDPEVLKVSTDWQDEAINPAPIQDHSISVSGGNETSKYSISGGMFDQESIMAFRSFRRYYARAKSEFKIGKKLTIGESFIVSRQEGLNLGFGNNLDLAYMLGAAPTMPVYDSNNDSGYAGPSAAVTGVNNRDNIIGRRDMNRAYTWNNKVLGSVYAAFEILPGLTYKLNTGLNFGLDRFKNYVPIFQMNNRGSNVRTLNTSLAESYEYLVENTLTYDKVFNEKVHLTVLGGYTEQNYFWNRVGGTRRDFPSNDIQVLSAGTGVYTLTGDEAEWALRSFLGRANVTLFDKYLLTATFRRDGSSRFGANNRYGNFPSLAVGWNLDKEGFIQNVPFISGLKLRASWGQLGNQDIGNYVSQTVVSTSARYFFGNDVIAPAAVVNSLGNPDLKWERTTQTDIGADIGLFDDKLLLTVDYWVKNTDGILVRTPISTVTGFTRDAGPYQNAAELQNKGFEFQATYRGGVGDLRYNVTGNISTVRNKVISLGSGSSIINLLQNVYYSGTYVRTIPGQPMSHFYGHIMDGIFQNQAEIDAHAVQPGAEPGDVRFRDINNDGVINADDRTNIGDPWPDFDYGLAASATYKNFDLTLSFYGVQGKELYDAQGAYLETMQGEWNNKTTVLNRWRGEGTSNTMPRAVRGGKNDNYRGSTMYVEDASFLRLQSLQIGYRLPTSLVERVGLKSTRVYFSGQNLLTITRYPNYNADTLGGAGYNDDSMSPLGFGVDTGSVPIPKVFSLGVNLVL